MNDISTPLNVLSQWIQSYPDVAGAVALIVFWALDWAVTKTPNPIDNMIVRWLKHRWNAWVKDAKEK